MYYFLSKILLVYWSNSCFFLNTFDKTVGHVWCIVRKGVSTPPFQNHPPLPVLGSPHFLKSPISPPSQQISHPKFSFINKNATVELSSINTIHVKQQHNVDFLIFKFSLKCSFTEKTVWEVYFKYTLIILHLHFLIKEVSNNFFNQWILFSYLGKSKKTLKIFHPPITKPTPPFLASPHF